MHCRYLHRLMVSSMERTSSFILVFGLLCFAIPLFSNTIIYVKPNGFGDGSSWQSPIGNLQVALNKATYGTEIWVAAGTYYTTETNDRNASFQIPQGIKLFGGFSGQESSLLQRQPLLYQTILSGEIGTPSNNDNAFNVIRTFEANSDTEIDGFYIVGGNANDWRSAQGSSKRSGGGWYNEVGNSTSAPIIRSCIFRGNRAIDGGAIYNNASKGYNSLVILNSQFIGNVAMSDGGAIYNDCRLSGEANLVVDRTVFHQNESNNGGCIFNYSFNGNGYGQFTDCEFASNTAMSRGSIIYNGSYNRGAFDVNNCRFLDNKSHEGNPFYQISEGDRVPPQKVKVRKI